MAKTPRSFPGSLAIGKSSDARKKHLGRCQSKIGGQRPIKASRGSGPHLVQSWILCGVLHDLDAVAERARHLAQMGALHAVVGAGGDGTASAVVARLPSGIPFYPYPLGTENLLARQFGIVAEPKASARAIDQCHTQTLDAAEANGRFFC